MTAGRIRRRPFGYTLVELAVVTTLFGILATLVLGRVHDRQREIEQIQVMQFAAMMRSELYLRVIHLIASDRRAAIAGLAGQNPMAWLRTRPRNYVGELSEPETTQVSTGNWYFNKSTSTLTYLLNPGTKIQGIDAKQLNFKVKLINNKLDDSGQSIPDMNTSSVEMVQMVE